MWKILGPKKRGYKDYFSGCEKTDNPYEKGTPSRRLWDRGFDDAFSSCFETKEEFKKRMQK